MRHSASEFLGDFSGGAGSYVSSAHHAGLLDLVFTDVNSCLR